MLRPVFKGTTNVSTVIRILDSTTFLPETGVISATPGLTLEYRRDVTPGNTPLGVVAISPLSTLASLTTAHTDNGLIHIGNGYYRVDVEDAAFAAGADGVLIEGTATDMVIIGVYHPLTTYDPYDAGLGIFLDRLFAADYDPTANPGVATALLNELTQDDGNGVAQFTVTALETAPFSPSGLPQLEYLWDTDITETDPGAGNVKADNATLGNVTEIYVNNTTDNGGLADVYFSALQVNDVVSLNKAQNPSSRLRMRVTDRIDNTGWWTIQGTVIDSQNAFSNNDKLIMVLSYQSNTAAGIANAVWDELQADHLTPNTFGAQAFEVLAAIFLDELMSKVDADNIVDGSLLAKIMSATSDGSTFVPGTDSLEAIRDRGDAAWTTGAAGSGLTPLAGATAQGGTASTIQLAAGETFADDELKGNVVKITAGTGAGQARLITAYTSASDTASVAPNWVTTPDATSVYEVVEGYSHVADIEALTANKIADHILRRAAASARASADGDTVSFRSLLGATSKLVNKVGVVGTDLVTREEDDATAFGTQAITTDAAADPITDLDTT